MTDSKTPAVGVLPELADLIGAYCDATLRDDQQERLEAILRGNAEAQRVFLSYLDIHARLCWEGRGSSPAAEELPAMSGTTSVPPLFPADNLSRNPAGSRRASGVRRRFSAFYFRLALSVAVAAIAVLFGLWHASESHQAAKSPLPEQPTMQPIARVTRGVGRWTTNDALGRVGDALRPGLLDLEQGIVEICYDSGAVVLLEAPSKLELFDKRRAYLHRGRVVARVPKQAIGFTIETSQASLVDLGTEFGIAADPKDGMQVQVFDGVVIAELKDTDDPKSAKERLVAGQAREIAAAGSPLREIAFQPRRFLRTFPASADRLGPQTPYNASQFSAVPVVPSPATVIIDGDLSEWNRSGLLRSACIEPYSAQYFVEIAMMYDARRLYLGAHVGDPAPMCNAVDPRLEPHFYWAGGSVVVRLCTNKSLGWPLDAFSECDDAPLQARKGRRAQDSDVQIVHVGMWYSRPEQRARLMLEYGMNGNGRQLDPAGFEGAFRKDADGGGYTLEYAIPWELLHAGSDPPRAGDTLPASYTVHWSDQDGRTCMGQLVEVTNPAAKPYHFLRGPTWGKAVFRPLDPSSGTMPARQRGEKPIGGAALK